MSGRKCKKCGQWYSRAVKYHHYCIDGYEIDDTLCVGCNAVASVVERYRSGGEVTIDDLKRLPNFLIFDPNGDDVEEAVVGQRLFVDIKKIEKNC